MHPRLADLTLVGLAPLLVAQGRRVRRDTPRLPEPPGDRQGTRGEGTPLSLLILGDSAAAGVGAPSQDTALLGQLVDRLSGQHRVTWQLVARTGMTTTDAREALFQGEHVGRAWDIVVVSLGVNDATRLMRSGRFRRHTEALLTRIQRELMPGVVVLSGLPPLHRFPALPEPLRSVIGARARRLDRALSAIAAQRGPSVVYLKLPFVELDAEAMASDGFHPGPPVYAAWATQVLAAIDR